MAVYYESYYGVSSLGSNDYLMHHGIKGMKWGVRRYQNPDGTLTDAGRRRYDVGKPLKEQAKKAAKSIRKGAEAAAGKAKSIYRTVDRYLAKRAAKRGDAETFMKHTKNLTDDEIKSALNRINTIQSIDNLRAQRQKNNFDRFNRSVSAIKTSVEIGVAAGKGLKKFSKWVAKSDNDDADKLYQENLKKQVDKVAGEARKQAIAEKKSVVEQEVAAREAIRELANATKKADKERSKSKALATEFKNNEVVQATGKTMKELKKDLSDTETDVGQLWKAMTDRDFRHGVGSTPVSNLSDYDKKLTNKKHAWQKYY